MKNKTGFVVLIVICVVLGIALLVRSKQGADEKKKDTETILYHSNQWQESTSKLDEQKQVNVTLENDLKTRKDEIVKLTNDLGQTSATLAKTAGELAEARKAAQEEIARRDAKIADLESQNRSLDKQALELSTAITNLNTQITETQRKLASAEGDKAFLEKELKRLMTEKAELERQFNDIKILRAQVAKLREELNISRRLEWIRKGLFGAGEQKGAQQLIQQGPGAAAAPGQPASYDLNVEVGADGTVRVIPPLTNRPAATNPPPK